MKPQRFSSTAILALLGVLSVAAVRGRVARQAEAVKQVSDIYALPPFEVLRPASMGYVSAFADLIWAHVLVTQGLRASERRPFQHLDEYLNAVTELDPAFREPYRLADSLLIFQQNDPDPDHSAHVARSILEKGLARYPLDSSLWMNYGEFLAYVAPPSLKDPEQRRQWKLEGARALVRAGELGSRDENVYWHSIAAVGALSKEGEREAMLNFLRRVYVMTEDAELKRYIELKLQVLDHGRQEARYLTFDKRFNEMWRQTTPFATRTERRIIGPAISAYACAGPQPSSSGACSRDWRSWSPEQEGP